jgi:geranylgeranyl pyrophosphate synthase
MEWENLLDHYSLLIEQKLESYFSDVIESAKNYHQFIAKLYDNIREYSLRKGKRLASCSALLSYKGYTGKIDESILNVCVGIELYRHCILVHDDLVDKDMFRRGGKSFHKLFTIYDRRFGEGVAVFTGDLIFSLALKCISKSGFPIEKVDKALSLLIEGYSEVNESQILDLLFEYTNPDVNEWSKMAHKRAASLFRAAILIGAILGDAPDCDIEWLKEAATNIGYSFDIQDDIIDTFATKEQYGRKPGGDLIRGKKPLHIILMLQRVSKDGLELLDNIINKRYITNHELETIKQVIRESEALKFAKEESKRHAEFAKNLIAKTSMNYEIKNFFFSFINYIEESLDWYK